MITRDSDAVFTSTSYAERINEQIAKYFYATNTPFLHVGHKEFIKLCQLLRPGYSPPNEKSLAGDLLDITYKKTTDESTKILSGESVTMCLDGWSNVHNEPLICASIITSNGENYLSSTIDTSGISHDSDYLCTLAKKCIIECKKKFNANVRSFVTDNAGNVNKMREKLSQSEDSDVTRDIIYYGCSAHILNLLAKDLKIPGITAQVVTILKYFKYTHLPNAWYREVGGKMLVIPQEVRWNTYFDSIKCFLENRGKLVQICQDHKNDIDKHIFKLVNDVNLTVNCTDYLEILKPIANALDKMQRDSTKLAESVDIWNNLKQELESCSCTINNQAKVKKHFEARQDMALSTAHFAANLLDHRYCGRNLSEKQKQGAFHFLQSVDKEILPLAMKFLAKKAPFPSYMFESQFLDVDPTIWWANIDLETELKKKMSLLSEQLFTATPTTAGLERIFSTFGLIQSKLRNRLGTEKASKLTFILTFLNHNQNK